MTDKKYKILLVEDDVAIALAYKDGLTIAGFEVVQAQDGEKALEVIKSVNPDIVLTDIIMPFKDGFEMLEEIKKDTDLKNIPVIVLSNIGQEEDIEKGKLLGASDYLVKADHSMAEIVEKVNKILKK